MQYPGGYPNSTGQLVKQEMYGLAFNTVQNSYLLKNNLYRRLLQENYVEASVLLTRAMQSSGSPENKEIE